MDRRFLAQGRQLFRRMALLIALRTDSFFMLGQAMGNATSHRATIARAGSGVMDTFRVKKDGRLVGTLKGNDARTLGMVAVDRWGPGSYEIKLVRKSSDEEE